MKQQSIDKLRMLVKDLQGRGAGWLSGETPSSAARRAG
jgi:hypothetical protein